ncbi:hypothetical protein TRFO_09403 [Tritrichomonas foetus]|uniref:SH3 domain-containing protein n=1 Tax=Tritrichomonas foetus TaxID=1144522 RepID=A0A1J4JIQ6_9EUKA|nr:hypothetical protein TRFO_09403 [Tritrichomonas foetus]|eukprot:OHS97421.1 hypothetical protein TRFO_09403 [Tritrichomonas foetus]
MSIWRKRSGIAIIKNTYLANGPHQMTVIVGDHISVFEGTDLWLRGKNLYTGKIGIFPLVCASFKEDVDAAPGENCDLDTNKYLLDENDLLKIEAQETIKYALLESANQNQCQNSEESQGDSNNREESDTKNNNENSESSTNKENSKTDKISKKKLSKSFPEIANRISDVITQLELCNKSQTSQSIISAHSALGKNIDNLRDALNLPINPRSFYSTMTTLSTWGRSTNQKTLNNPTNNFMNVSSSFSSSTNVNSELTQSTNNISNQNISGMSSGSNDGNKSNENRYVIIHACVDIKSLQKPMICRFFLYNATKKNFLALPLSLNVTPEKSTHDLVFDKIDRGMINSNLYLVIYTYEMKKNVGQPDQSSKRKNFACAVIPLPECDKNENFGNSTTIESQSVKIDEKAKLPPLHELLTSNDEEAISQAKLIRCIPNISVKITPFYGTTESVIQGQSLQKCEIIRPLLLPSSLTRNEIYSMLTVHLSNFNFDVLHKKTKMSFRLIDTGNKSFVPAIESIDSSLHNKTVWNCNQYKGRGFLYSEIFSVDLSVTKSPLKDLYLIVQVDKCGLTETKLSPNSFGVLPLASDIGSFTMKTKGKIRFYLLPSNNKDGVNVDDLCKFIEKNHSVLKKSFSSNSSTSQDKAIKEKGTKNKNAPKKVGSVNYNLDLASNQLTQNQELFKLLNYTEYTNDLKHSIENFMFCGISEWSKYSPNLLLNLCTIMANMPDFALSAFIAIQQMIGELTSNAGMKYKRSLIDFVEKEFNPFYPTANTNNLEKVSDTMIPLFISSLEGDVTDIKFRNFIKTLPFFLKLISRSYKINPTPERLTKINQIFSILNNIMKKSETVNEKNQNNHENNDNGAENNKAMATYTLMNQKILLLHFSSLLDDLLMCFEPSDSAKFINNFMESVDNENSTLINSKMQLLVDLSTKNIWHKDSTKLLNGLFLKELKEAILREDGIKIILQILPNIMHSSNSTFVISFLPLIDNLLKTSDNKLVLQLLMAIAFNFPKDFPLHLLIYLTKSNNLECSERLFIFVFVLTQKKDDIIKIYQKKDSLSEKYELFDLFWEIALSSKKKSKYPLDTYLSSFIYHFNNDFSILMELL